MNAPLDPADSYTVQRLRNLKPGERMVYYRGNFESDLGKAPPNYRALLEFVYFEVMKLAGEKRIVADMEENGKRFKNSAVEFEYTAKGIAAK
jgi:hypothetical protein